MNCLVPSSKFYLFKLSDNKEAQQRRSDRHKCYNNARTSIQKGNPIVTKISLYLETEQGINREFRKQVFFKMNSSLGSFLLHCNGDEKASVPLALINKTIIETALYFFFIANATELAFKGGPGAVGDVFMTAGATGVNALRYLYGPDKVDWLTYYRSFQRTH